MSTTQKPPLPDIGKGITACGCIIVLVPLLLMSLFFFGALVLSLFQWCCRCFNE